MAADIPAIPPAAAPALTRRQALAKATEYSGAIANHDLWLVGNGDPLLTVAFQSAVTTSPWMKIDGPEARHAAVVFLKSLRSLNEAKCQEMLAQAVEAEQV